MRILSMVAAVGATLALASLAHAVSFTLENFDNYTGAAPYAGFQTGTITPGPTSLRVQASGFGGAYIDYPDVNAVGGDTFQLKATVNSGLAGFVVALGDAAGHEKNYAFYGNPVGDYTFTRRLSGFNFSTGTSGPLDLANLAYAHIQVDPGTSADPYDVTFNDLSITPEPASLAACGLAGVLLRRRRR